jgi:hypothetical protein
MKYGFAIILAKTVPMIGPSLLGYASASTSGISIKIITIQLDHFREPAPEIERKEKLM